MDPIFYSLVFLDLWKPINAMNPRICVKAPGKSTYLNILLSLVLRVKFQTGN
jgi:hypothetical protein